MTLVGLTVLFLWLTLQVDLVIFAGVLFAISLRRAAKALSRQTRLPVGWALFAVVLLIMIFFAGIGWFFSQSIASQIDQLSEQLPAAAEKVGNIISQSDLGKALIRHLDTGNLQTSPASDWMLGRLFSMSVLGIMTAIGLWLLGIPLPVALGFLAGILTFVPYRQHRLRCP